VKDPVASCRLPVASAGEASVTDETALNNAMLYCPNCSEKLRDRGCKLRCPRCHYYMSCSDYV
jgi:hypothetical protein